MSRAAGSGAPRPAEPPREHGAPPELPPAAGAGEASGDPPAEPESPGRGRSPSAAEGRRGGSESGRGSAAAGDKPETRSVCSSESGSGSQPGGAGPICKICFQGPEQVRRDAAVAGGRRVAVSTRDRARRRRAAPHRPAGTGGW